MLFSMPYFTLHRCMCVYILQRLKQGLSTGHWKVYERWEEPSVVHLVLSVDIASIAALERIKWPPIQ
jgi:hypothetical protein